MQNHKLVRYRPIADNMKVRLYYTESVSLPPLTSFQISSFSVSNALLRPPKYLAQIYRLYKDSYLHGINLSIEFANVGARPFQAVLAESNTVDLATVSFAKLAQTPRAKYHQVVINGNKSVVNFNHQASLEALVGHKCRDDSDWWSSAVSGPTTSLPQPLLVLGYEPSQIGASVDAIYTVKISYDMEFFTINQL
jgi:hypothetical protein